MYDLVVISLSVLDVRFISCDAKEGGGIGERGTGLSPIFFVFFRARGKDR